MMQASCLDDRSGRCGPVEPRSKSEVKSTTCEEFLSIMKEFSESSGNAKEMAQRVDSLVHQDQTLLRLFPTTSRHEGPNPESQLASIVAASENKTRNTRNTLVSKEHQPMPPAHAHEDLAEWMELDLEFEREMDHFNFHLHLDSPHNHGVAIPEPPATATARSVAVEPTTSPFMKQQAGTSHAFFKANHHHHLHPHSRDNSSKQDQPDEEWTLFRKSRLSGLDKHKDQERPLSVNTQLHSTNSSFNSSNSQVRHAPNQQSVMTHDSDSVKARVSPLFGQLDLTGTSRTSVEKPRGSTSTVANPVSANGDANGSSTSLSRRHLTNLHALQTSEKMSRSSTQDTAAREPEDDDEANVWGMEDDEYEQNLLDSIDHTVLCDRENRFLQWDLELNHGSSNSGNSSSKSSRTSEFSTGSRGGGSLFTKNSALGHHTASNVPRAKSGAAFLASGSLPALHGHGLVRKSKSCSSFSPRDKLNKSPSAVEIDLDFGTFQNRTVSHILSSCLHKRKLHHPYKNQVKLVNFHIPSATNQPNLVTGMPGASPHAAAAAEGRGSLATSLAFGTQENEFHHGLGTGSSHLPMATSSIASMSTTTSSSNFSRSSDLLSPFGMSSDPKNTKSTQSNELKSKKREERKRMMSQKLQETLAEFEGTFTEQELDFKRSSSLAANALFANNIGGVTGNQLSKMALENLPLPDLTNLPQDLKELKRKIEMTEHKVEGTKHRHRKGGPCPRCQVQNQLRAAKRAYHKRAVAHKKLPQSAAALVSCASVSTASSVSAGSTTFSSPVASIAAAHAAIPRAVTPSPPPTPVTATRSTPVSSSSSLAVPAATTAATMMVTPTSSRPASTSIAVNKVIPMTSAALASQGLMLPASFASASVTAPASSAQVLTAAAASRNFGGDASAVVLGSANVGAASALMPLANDALLTTASTANVASPTSSENIDLSPLEITEDPAVRAVLEMEENDDLLDVPLSPVVDTIPGAVNAIDSLALPVNLQSRNPAIVSPMVPMHSTAATSMSHPSALATAAAAVAATIATSTSTPMQTNLVSHSSPASSSTVVHVVRNPAANLSRSQGTAYSSASSTAPSSSVSSSNATSSASTPSSSPSQLQQHVTVSSG